MADTAPAAAFGGFLGAGGTTLLNHLPRRPALAGTAVLVNEFGEIGFDHRPVERPDADTVLLHAGCLCCTVRGHLMRALADLLPRVEAGAVQRVVIETTGLARIAAFCLTLEKRLRWQGVAAWLDMLVATRGELLLRSKGILNVAGQDRPVVIHGVQHLFHPPAMLAGWPDDDPRTSRLVFITGDLPGDVIEERLHAFNDVAAWPGPAVHPRKTASPR